MSQTKVLLVTPPFTQLNTPYPGTNYLKGYLKTIDVNSFQMDLGIEVILRLFSKDGLSLIFGSVEHCDLSENAQRICILKDEYLQTIEPVIRFLQHKNPTLAYTLVEEDFLPQASRFEQLEELDWAFGALGIQDKARHLATLYLEDLADLIKETVDPHFGFSRYAERLGMSASSFTPIYEALNGEKSLVDTFAFEILRDTVERKKPDLVCLSVPFPGNLFGALRCGQFLKQSHPSIKIAMGGGYPNTELRSINDARVFEFIDYITLDDGERPIRNLIEYLQGDRELQDLKRTFTLIDETVEYVNGSKERDVPFSQTGTPSYEDLKTDQYLSVIEVTNPMHRLWSDGRWNKLTMAHGCYWKKCTFCDISLDYIKNYEPVGASMLCDRMEEQIAETGETGFHFVDEAAPPALMKELALEIVRRGLKVTWWTNIRFEKSFTADLCSLLKISGCIAVSGGLEVASDRLLDKMDKGVTVAQVARVANHFTQRGVMVHAYLMYGFPTQTAQETIDSLEMVRQLFLEGAVQSGFWHQFAMTSHAPIGISPSTFGVEKVGPVFEGFADNDLWHEDVEGTDHPAFSDGLKKSLFNYMHGVGFDIPLHEWFDFDVPNATIFPNYIESVLEESESDKLSPQARVVWMHKVPQVSNYKKKKKGKNINRVKLSIVTRSATYEVIADVDLGDWFKHILDKASIFNNGGSLLVRELFRSYEETFNSSTKHLLKCQAWNELRNIGLLIL